jgi:hypothetical protein
MKWLVEDWEECRNSKAAHKCSSEDVKLAALITKNYVTTRKSTIKMLLSPFAEM